MNIDTSYSLRSQQYQQLQKSNQSTSASAISDVPTDQEDRTKDEYTTTITSAESGDRIEISAEGQKALAQMQEAQSATQLESEESSSAQPSAPAGPKPSGPPPAASSIGTDDSEDDEETASTELYTLSETKLQSLLNDGSITRSEYTSELARRGLENDT